MSLFPLNTDDLLGSREIRFINRKESNYPNLMRLCLDFELAVLQLQRKTYSHISLRLVPTAPEFVLVNREYDAQGIVAMTPICSSLQTLEAYVIQHQIDLLHAYLFGSEDEVTDPVTYLANYPSRA
jgi:hypothetical protein